jgi:S-adenosylmethionine synthetase
MKKGASMDKANLRIYSSGRPRIDGVPFEVVERKGIGHPDTLCDTIAELVSGAYSRHCLEHHGTILRHMVDKIALSGGSSKVHFGGGEMVRPIRLYLNCRFTRNFGKHQIPYLDIVKSVVKEHFAEVMPLLDFDQWVTIVDNTHFSPGPGVVYESDGTSENERRYFFEVPDDKFALFHGNSGRSNDTSTAVAYAPPSNAERIAILVETTLNGKEFKKRHPYVGTDIKVMVRRFDAKVDVTVCVPFIAQHTPSKEFYFEKLETLKAYVKELVASNCSEYEVSVMLNTRDDPSRSDYYLTLTGSAIESGDEGVVGRGNRYNGVIPFVRHMSMEACCGKNPVYHVGKLYTAIASLIASDIHRILNLESYVYMTSQMGRGLSDPWSVCVEVAGTKLGGDQRQAIEAIVERQLANASRTTSMIVSGELKLY